MSFSFLSGDILFIIITFVVIMGYTFYFGKSKIVSFILSFYPTVFIYNNTPFLDKLLFLDGELLITINKLSIFMIIFIILNIITNRYVGTNYTYYKPPSMLSNIVLALGGVILVLVLSYSTISLDPLYNLGGGIDPIFGAENTIFYWSLVPLLLLAIF